MINFDDLVVLGFMLKQEELYVYSDFSLMESVVNLSSNGVIMKTADGPPSKPDSAWYKLSPKGEVFLKMLCETPFPEVEVKWVDPRNGRVIELDKGENSES